MKKILTVVLTFAMLASTFAAVIPQSIAVTHGYQLGDVNDDGLVNMKDLLLLKKYVSGSVGERDIDVPASDVETDSAINAKDPSKLRKVIAGAEDLDGNNTDNKYKVDKISIGNRSISRYTVILPADADPCAEFAAQELVDRIYGACGYKLNIARDESRVFGCKIRFVHDNDCIY